jgi:hypothetical protein
VLNSEPRDFRRTSFAYSSFETAVAGRIIWGYQQPDSCLNDLYEIAKRKSWNASTDIVWDGFSRYDHYPTLRRANPLIGFDEYEALPQHERRRLAWWIHGVELSEILHGEQAALIIASQLVSCLPTLDAKLFASSQVHDEARHVEFFSRYLREVVGEVHSPSPELLSVIETAVTDPTWEMKLIVCQILIESLAMARFKEIKQCIRVPLVRHAIDYIAKDEARHVHFGVQLLETHLRALPSAELEARVDFILDNMLKLINTLNGCTVIADSMRWDVANLRCHLRLYRLKNPDIARNRLQVLVRNLESVGLLTAHCQKRIKAIYPSLD